MKWMGVTKILMTTHEVLGKQLMQPSVYLEGKEALNLQEQEHRQIFTN
jgi:hypothetical protein